MMLTNKSTPNSLFESRRSASTTQLQTLGTESDRGRPLSHNRNSQALDESHLSRSDRTSSSPMTAPPPSQADFLSTGRDAFSFLASFGFTEVRSPISPTGAEFELWYQAGGRFVGLKGDGRGTEASVLLATADRRGASYIRYVPAAERSLAKCNSDQLAIVRAVAAQVAAHAQDFLCGKLTEYAALGKALPPHQTLPGVP